jgi:hypothetical protein
MGRVGKSLLWGLLVLVTAPVGAFVAYDAVVFQPRMPQMRALLEQANAEDRAAPPNVVRMLHATPWMQRSPVGDAGHVARILLAKTMPGDGNRHGTHALWTLLVRLHFDETERMALYVSQSYNGVDQGMDRLARRMFDKPLHALDDLEAAKVVVFVQGPSLYSHDPARLAEAATYLVTRAE